MDTTIRLYRDHVKYWLRDDWQVSGRRYRVAVDGRDPTGAPPTGHRRVVTMPKRDDRVAPPPGPAEWDVRFADASAWITARTWEAAAPDDLDTARAAASSARTAAETLATRATKLDRGMGPGETVAKRSRRSIHGVGLASGPEDAADRLAALLFQTSITPDRCRAMEALG